MLFIVANGDNQDGALSLNAIDHLVWEPFEQRPASEVVDQGKRIWRTSYSLDNFFQFFVKIGRDARPGLSKIIVQDATNIFIRRGKKPCLHLRRYCLIESQNSSSDMINSGCSLASSSRRRASSPTSSSSSRNGEPSDSISFEIRAPLSFVDSPRASCSTSAIADIISTSHLAEL